MKNLCSYCGTLSKTDAPFPKKDLSGGWNLVVCPKCFSVEELSLLERPKEDEDEFRETFISQHKGEPRRKMVSNSQIDLTFWFDESDSVIGFQYCLGKSESSLHAFTWSQEKGSHFHRVVTERRKFRTNTLEANGPFPREEYESTFLQASKNLRQEYKDIVLKALRGCGGS